MRTIAKIVIMLINSIINLKINKRMIGIIGILRLNANNWNN